LALGESLGKSGRETLAAFVAGFEVAARLANSVEPAHSQAGWHTTSSCGVFGAATACGKMLGLDQESMMGVFGIAASFSGGLRKNMGTPVKYLHAGHAAQNGLKAAILGSHGFYGSRDMFSGKQSFGEVFSSPLDCEKLTEGLNEQFEVCANGFKLYPCCASAHSAIDAALSLRAKWRVRPEDIEEIKVGTVPIVLDNLRYGEPANTTEARFSMPFCISLALTDGQVTLDSFSTNRLQSGQMKELMKRVTLYLEPEMKSLGYRGTENSRVTIITRDRQVMTERVDAARGHPFNPASEEELRDKFFQCCKRALEAESAVKLLAVIENFQGLSNVQQLFCSQDFACQH
jgi:2-methylcitrate dehydratase PrpD